MFFLDVVSGFQRSPAVGLYVQLGQDASSTGGHWSLSSVHTCTTLQVCFHQLIRVIKFNVGTLLIDSSIFTCPVWTHFTACVP